MQAPRSIFRSSFVLAWIPLTFFGVTEISWAGDPPDGERIYRERCASCHGLNGEGTKDNYAKPLIGDRSVAQLAKLIAETMPQDDPGTCTGAEAEQVAAYIYDAFYSKMAQVRNAPPRIELSRLTVRQYRNAVADLIASFGPTPSAGSGASAEQGLRAEYYKSRRFRNGERVLQRIDPQVAFDFGTGGPEPDKFEPQEFSIRWEGTILAPETGDYELIIRTEHAARLWLNDLTTPLIDAWVKSGNDTEYRASMFLLGGRSYPVRLEFSKAKQGVDDSKTRKDKPPAVPASIALLWKLPHQAVQVVPRHALRPDRSPPTFVVATPFPPDDRSMGYERGNAISKAWDQATTEAAIEVANQVVRRQRELTGAREDSPDREAKLKAFGRAFASRAFRHPLTDDEAALYIDRQFQDGKDLDLALKRVVLLVLKSPRFLYRETTGNSPDEVASRIAFTLWDSIPDATLRDAAAAGQLTTPEQIARQAERMVQDPRNRSKLREFLLQWLKVDTAPDLAKDPNLYPEFTPELAADLRTSLDLFLDDVIQSPESDFRRLLLAEETYLNGRLARFYGVDLPPDAPFQKVVLDPRERAGVLSHPYLMSAFAYTATSSPIHRGVFLARGLLGKALRPPPVAVAPLAPDLHPGLTTRERVITQTSPEACQTCHSMINPLGFTLEHFDAVGRFRTLEKGKPIVADGTYQARNGQTVSFQGVQDLAAFLAQSDETQTAFVEQLFHYLVKQPLRAFHPAGSGELRHAFAEQGFNIRKLMVDITVQSALIEPKSRDLATNSNP